MVDLFIYDANLRHDVLLRHFAPRFSKDLSLESVKTLVMADGRESKLSHNGGK